MTRSPFVGRKEWIKALSRLIPPVYARYPIFRISTLAVIHLGGTTPIRLSRWVDSGPGFVVRDTRWPYSPPRFLINKVIAARVAG